MTSVNKLEWAAFRLVFLAAAFGGMVTGGILAYILSPLCSWLFFNDLNPVKYHRKFIPLIVCGWKIVFDWITDPAYRGMFSVAFTAPPLSGPDLSLVRISNSWNETGSSCNGCIRCCTVRDCPLIDAGRKACLSYGSFYWRYFNCGRYPENTRQITYYKCPKWEVSTKTDAV